MYKIREYPNGLRLITKKMPSVSSAALGFWVNTGSRNEETRLNGVSHYLEHLLFKGSRRFSGDTIKESIEGLGGSLNAFTAEENTCYYAKFLGKHLKKVGTVLADMVLHPLLKPKDIEKERTVIIEEIKMYKDLPAYQVQEIYDAITWPGHALGRNIAGTITSVSGLTRRDIAAYHGRWYRPASVVVSCAGDLDEEVLDACVSRAFGKLKRTQEAPIDVFTDAAKAPCIRIVSKDIEQTNLIIGFPGLERTHKDRYALGVMNVLFGGNMSSRLFNEVREKRGLAYAIASHAKRFKDNGAFFVYAGVDRKNFVEATHVILEETARLKRDGVAAGELRRAKEFLTAQSVMALDDTMDHMLWMGEALLNTGMVQTKEEVRRRIARVTAADVVRVARRLLSPPRMRVAAVGPQVAKEEAVIRKAVDSFARS